MRTAQPSNRALRATIVWVLEAVRSGALDEAVRIPAPLRRASTAREVPVTTLATLRRVIDEDEALRVALVDYLDRLGPDEARPDRLGLLWLARPAGWLDQVGVLLELDEQRQVAEELAVDLRREERRRAAVEEKLARQREAREAAERSARAKLERSGDERRRIELLQRELGELRAEVAELKKEVRHGVDRLRAAERRGESERERADRLQGELEQMRSVRDDVLAHRAATIADRADLIELSRAAEALAGGLRALLEPHESSAGRRGAGSGSGSGVEPSARRRALPMPGGVTADSVAGIEYLLRCGALVIVDGYNVSMSAWPQTPLDEQRNLLIGALENTARRFGTEITVVFDGSSVVGAVARRRRLIRVVFSPEGTIADDVIRAEVRQLDQARQVVVVTSDGAVVRSTRAMGANTVRSDRFLEAIR